MYAISPRFQNWLYNFQPNLIQKFPRLCLVRRHWQYTKEFLHSDKTDTNKPILLISLEYRRVRSVKFSNVIERRVIGGHENLQDDHDWLPDEMIGNCLISAVEIGKCQRAAFVVCGEDIHGINVSRQTVNRRLLQHGYWARRMTKCPRLTVQRRVAWLCWAREHRRLQLWHWRHVIFTDESRYILDRTDGRQRVRRLRGENLRDDCIPETTQGGGASVMVWAGIHYGWKTPLVVPDGNVNAVVYLEYHCLPHARRVYVNNFRLQDDNARAHIGPLQWENFLMQRGCSRCHGLLSPLIMNPIEHACDALGRAINERDNIPQTVQELALSLTE